MNGAEITLAAPAGYCFDPASLRRDVADGFALLPRCSRLKAGGFFASFGSGAIITAALGKVDGKAPRPTTSELAASVEGAHVLERREDELLPLVKLDMADHGAKGASSEHWRGAFVQDGHVILLSLYAPDNSPLLGRGGADLLLEMARLTRDASAPPPAEPLTPAARSAPPPAARTASGRLRPQSRPQKDADRQPGVQKPLLLQRITGLFD